MYRIYCHPNGKFICACQVQDGTEQWEEATLDAAIKSVKRFAKAERRGTIRKRDITFLRPEQTVETRYVAFKP